MTPPYHLPALAKESIEALAIKPEGVYVDVTFGGGGHSKLIIEQLSDKGHLYGFDQDEDALNNAFEDGRFTFIQSNFRYLKRFLKLQGVKQVDGILADLGVSFHQFDEGSRGFSFRYDALFDMRMNQQGTTTAADVVNQYTADDLQQVFSKYGEVRNAKTLAQAIVEARAQRQIKTINDFLAVIDRLIRGQRQKYLAQVFQALRIEVNEEMEALEELLQQSLEILNSKGRLAVISYHSIEDRMVKNFMKTGNVKGEVEKDFYGNISRPFTLINKRAIVPNDEEIKLNPRARSAKLRIAEKN
ncbi:MAG: 16S rRNA (cytosine(1402)-N(4))-methyltransferase RsmH [Bacteroidota bacterium]